jgi:hypothetical protein
MFYRPGVTPHGLARDPFKVRTLLKVPRFHNAIKEADNLLTGLCSPPAHRLDLYQVSRWYG